MDHVNFLCESTANHDPSVMASCTELKVAELRWMQPWQPRCEHLQGGVPIFGHLGCGCGCDGPAHDIHDTESLQGQELKSMITLLCCGPGQSCQHWRSLSTQPGGLECDQARAPGPGMLYLLHTSKSVVADSSADTLQPGPMPRMKTPKWTCSRSGSNPAIQPGCNT